MSIRKRVNLLESDGDILRSHIQVLEAQIALLVARIEMLEAKPLGPWTSKSPHLDLSQPHVYKGPPRFAK